MSRQSDNLAFQAFGRFRKALRRAELVDDVSDGILHDLTRDQWLFYGDSLLHARHYIVVFCPKYEDGPGDAFPVLMCDHYVPFFESLEQRCWPSLYYGHARFSALEFTTSGSLCICEVEVQPSDAVSSYMRDHSHGATLEDVNARQD